MNHSPDEHAQLQTESSGSLSQERSELDRFGIERVQTESFLWGGYRYSNARDALAAAKRGQNL